MALAMLDKYATDPDFRDPQSSVCLLVCLLHYLSDCLLDCLSVFLPVYLRAGLTNVVALFSKTVGAQPNRITAKGLTKHVIFN